MVNIFKVISREISEWAVCLISFLPGVTGRLIREVCIKRSVRNCGKNISLGVGIKITGHKNIEMGSNIIIMDYSRLSAGDAVLTLGSNIGINANVTIDASRGGNIKIGNNVLIAQNVVLRASDHNFSDTDIPIIQQGHSGGKIIIGDDCWIGANVVITANVEVGDHSIVAAGAVVTRTVEPFSIVGGVPARTIRRRL